MTTGKVLMVQGTSSSAGKSLLVSALCCIYARRGLRVAPFKAQNMSNNAAVCPDGSEIGRAQAVQAAAAGVELCADLNPVLIKPEADARSQVVLMGRPWRTLSAGEYYRHKDFLWEHVTAALDRLRAAYDLVLIEGAGSPAEINLRPGDIVNMAVALYARAPVLLVGDIDRGGIFAQLLGTLWLLPPEERRLVRGLVVNKFRGDPDLFAGGVHLLEEKGGTPVLGVVPYLWDLRLPEEDAVALEAPGPAAPPEPARVDIAVLRFPRIANFDDFDPLAAEPGVRLRYVDCVEDLGDPDAILLPGTKHTAADLAWMRSQGLAEAVARHAARGGAVAGICGGYQMLGRAIRDPHGVETPDETVPGLGLLPAETRFAPLKNTYQARARITRGPGWMSALEGQEVSGYEIHMGTTQTASPWLEITRRGAEPVQVPDGAADPQGRVWGCYLHGLFANTSLRRAWLENLGWRPDGQAPAEEDTFQREINRLADTVEAALDIDRLEEIVWGS